MGFWEPQFQSSHTPVPTFLFEGKEHLGLLQEAIASKQLLEFQLFDDTHPSTQIPLFWARPYALSPFRQRDAVISAIHPYERHVFHIKLSDLRYLRPVSTDWLASNWLQPIDYQLSLSPVFAKRYEIKPHETRLGSTSSGETSIHVSKELQYKALSRCVKYANLVELSSADDLNSKLQAFQDLQARIFEES